MYLCPLRLIILGRHRRARRPRGLPQTRPFAQHAAGRDLRAVRVLHFRRDQPGGGDSRRLGAARGIQLPGRGAPSRGAAGLSPRQGKSRRASVRRLVRVCVWVMPLIPLKVPAIKGERGISRLNSAGLIFRTYFLNPCLWGCV